MVLLFCDLSKRKVFIFYKNKKAAFLLEEYGIFMHWINVVYPSLLMCLARLDFRLAALFL